MENAEAEIAKLTESIQQNIADSRSLLRLIKESREATGDVVAKTIKLLSEANESARRIDRLVGRA